MIKDFAKDFVVYGLSSGLARFLQFFLVPLYARVFSVEEFGQMDLISSTIFVCCTITLLQLTSGLARFFFQSEDIAEKNRLVSTAFWTITLLSGLFIGLSLFFMPSLVGLISNGRDFSDTLTVGLFTVILFNLNSLLNVVIQFKKKPWHFMGFQFLQPGNHKLFL